MEIDIPSLDDVKFEDSCDHCYGEGKSLEYIDVKKTTKGGKTKTATEWYTTECPRCKGSGRSLTDVGRRLLEFLRDRGVKFNDWPEAVE